MSSLQAAQSRLEHGKRNLEEARKALSVARNDPNKSFEDHQRMQDEVDRWVVYYREAEKEVRKCEKGKGFWGKLKPGSG
ncbi:hypothetical protein GLAREA_06836 [Glarea lozoyensis ATCC 20868]|uniref:Uncharacterized protein n=1 Tax=Glarea lozoyensis (strain ATCC 20868 / MF5171) TaxID=1116229 RepID=S3E646_GLAL2|nr:uncharacterized protein GLAREA_06836 [Glarea lozoyensis ATCC 20868]EPE33823.1 hypothetical protein GLAREA_06836 [Glarea lozoyensis ATCC 20868]